MLPAMPIYAAENDADINDTAAVGKAVPDGYYTMSFRSDRSMQDLNHDFYYSESFFEHSALEYDHALALATLGLLGAACNTWASDQSYWVNNDKCGRNAAIAEAYKKLGFGNQQFLNYDQTLNDSSDLEGGAYGQKTLVQNGKRTTLFVIMLSGGGYGARWGSNMRTGATGAHKGFAATADHTLEEAAAYIREAMKQDLGTVKLWLGGYSRGAVVAGLIAAKIGRLLPEFTRQNTFVYTFASPAALTAADRTDLQQDFNNNYDADGMIKEDWSESNIFNLISSSDIVGRVLPKEWGFCRNGNDRFLPCTTLKTELEDLDELGKEIGGSNPLVFSELADTDDADSLIKTALNFCVSRENYSEKYEDAFRDMLECGFIRTEEEVVGGVVLNDEQIVHRLFGIEGMKRFTWWEIVRSVALASTMSRPVLEKLGDVVPVQAKQVIVPVLAVGLCYSIESSVLKMLAYYMLSLMTVRGPLDNVLRVAYCHFLENYIALMEYYDPSDHGMLAYTKGK